MLQVTPQMRVLVAVEPVDFRKGIDGLAQVCRARLQEDPLSGTVFVFRNRQRKAIKLLVYDGQGFWLCTKRLSLGRFRFWPASDETGRAPLFSHELHVLLSGGNPSVTQAAPLWRKLPSQSGGPMQPLSAPG
jgi:transposase